jgi:large subunit ribosomal protein L32e
MAKDDVIKAFTKLQGVGKTKAELLYSNGFTSMDKLKKASQEDLVKVKGITAKNAEEILRQVHGKTTKAKPVKKTEEKEATPTTKKTTEKPASEKKEKEEKEDVIIEEEHEKEYSPKKKPKLTEKQKNSLMIRKQIKKRTPTFLREEWFRYKRIPRTWRAPDGMTSKMRKNLKYRPSKVRVGFRGPKEVRGLHSSGFQEILIHTPAELKNVDAKTQAVRIGSTVGTRKRLAIAQEAEKLEIRILNMKE